MIALMIVGGIVLIILFVIYLEYRNEKRYQEERRRHREKKKKKLSPKVTKRPKQTTDKTQIPPSHYAENKQKNKSIQEQKAVTETVLPKKEPAPKETPQTETLPKKEETKPQKEILPERVQKTDDEIDLPKGEYPAFNYDRLMEMGLSEEEAHEFIQELIPQIGEQIPLIDEAMKIPDFHQMERLTHSIKGSSTTIGTGGVSDLLVDYNTYLKSGEEIRIAEAYQKHLKHYYEKLKEQFPKG